MPYRVVELGPNQYRLEGLKNPDKDIWQRVAVHPLCGIGTFIPAILSYDAAQTYSLLFSKAEKEGKLDSTKDIWQMGVRE